MEEPIKEQPSADVSGNSAARPKLQRYALRSSSKSKEHKPEAYDCSNPSESKRGRSSPSVSRSVGVLDFSGKDKSSSAKPPRRLSIPVKASATPSPKPVGIGNTTPISETRTRRSGNGQGPQSRIQTPVSDIFRSSSRMKFSIVSSSSYWLNQIKLFESAAMHSISLGFFKLALEAGCEPFQKMQGELKSYVRRHELAELGEPVKELLERYNIAEIIEQSQVSESISQVPEEGTRSSDDDVHCSSSSVRLTPPPPVTTTESNKKETCQKKNPGTGSSLRENLRTNSANSSRPAASDCVNRRSVKKPEKPIKPESNKKKSEVKKQGKKSDVKEVSVSPTTRAGDNVLGNKENMDVRASDDGLTEVV